MGHKVVWRDEALDDLERIDAWLSTHEHAQPATVRTRISGAIGLLERLGDIGRPGQREGTRELSVRLAPYVIVYLVSGQEIEIVAVYHTAQDR
jgi:plasmid stabilization system protein ParE